MWKKRMTTGEAAEFLGISPQTLRSWGKTGRLPAYRHPTNGYRLYAIADLEKTLRLIKGRGQSRSKFILSDD